MLITNEEERREKLREFLFSLAKSQDCLQDQANRYNIYVQLEEIYHTDSGDDFRHFYSDIFSVLTMIKNDNSTGNIDVLGQNLSIIREEYRPKNKDINGNLIDISDSIRKLYDHVNLDIARITYSENQNRIYLGKDSLEGITAKIIKLETELPNVQKNLITEVNDVKKDLKSSQKEYISILGIFSSVVLAFTAGIAFSTSVLENIHKASIYRTLFICLIIAFVLINILYMLFKYTEKIVHGPSVTSKLKDYLPIIIANTIIIIIMAAIFCFWNSGAVELRNKRIHDLDVSQKNSSEIDSESITDNMEYKSNN